MSEPTWELLGGGGVVGGPIDYVGDWAAGIQYQPGQVVRYGGVDYLAVNPSLGQMPPVAVASVIPWQPWTPTLTGSGGMTVVDNGDSRNHSRYLIAGKVCYIKFARILTLGGTMGNEVKATLPVEAARPRTPFAHDLPNVRCGTMDWTTHFFWYPEPGHPGYPNWQATTTWFTAAGSYEIA